MRSGFPVSFTFHGAVLAWVALVPASPHREDNQSAFERYIAPNEKKIVWYRFNEKLPETAPPARSAPAEPMRARAKARQRIVSEGPRKAEQMVWRPVPRLEPQRDLESPNIVAMRIPAPPPAERAKPKIFTPPPERIREALGPAALPEAPALAASAGGAAPVRAQGMEDALRNRPALRDFRPPAARRATPASPPDLPHAPDLAAAPAAISPFSADAIDEALRNKPQPRAFQIPMPRQVERPDPALPAVPQIASAVGGQAPLRAGGITEALKNRPQPRPFKLPASRQAAKPAPVGLPQAPSLAAAGGHNAPIKADGVADALENRPQPKPFQAPVRQARVEPLPPLLQDAPAIDAPVGATDISAAIVGLRPAPRLDAPLPEGSRPGEFSAGPSPNSAAGTGEPSSSPMLSVSGLTVRDGADPRKETAPVLMARAAPTSEQALLEAARAPAPAAAISQGDVSALRVSTAPDALLEGREVYSLAVQMPNITSYYGSWMLWFAERVPASARSGLQPPVPVRKVDPRYVPSAVEEKIQGTVKLAATIRSDGAVSGIVVVRSLDSRLDFAATEAFSKWQFQPALRDGAPIEVDAIVEVPFRLASPENRFR